MSILVIIKIEVNFYLDIFVYKHNFVFHGDFYNYGYLLYTFTIKIFYIDGRVSIKLKYKDKLSLRSAITSS